MKKRYWVLALLTALFAGAGSLVPAGGGEIEAARTGPVAQAEALGFVRAGVQESRGRILAVVTSTPRFGPTGKNAGYELTELARAYYVFVANGYAVDVASPQGGKAPVNIDAEDMQAIDHAFLADPVAQHKTAETLALTEVRPEHYAAVYFVGGKGAMFDFPDNPEMQRIVSAIHGRGVVGAVCHGPAALFNVRLPDGRRLVEGRAMTGFTDAEELFLNENAREVFPFLLQERAQQLGARFVEGEMYLDHTVADGRLVTGQNPWSTWSVAEGMIRALGHAPVPRAATAEELSVRLLARYRSEGLAAALAERERLAGFDADLVRMHAVVAAMDWELGDAADLLRLAGF